eukprot:CAMPEP_0170447726 /NCGR_PEP_ID=MMETSP0117_2-20130122/50324_1 /TAXON_ID=400756 /ORGANISM="Durinskia baltica, Strain CSIRO CS-38" /LENGTH=86 /DNA_ID=CAMNT_0010708839 /DNA_START=75 /DNA_END=336 /DNA_ORIENTATION=-
MSRAILSAVVSAASTRGSARDELGDMHRWAARLAQAAAQQFSGAEATQHRSLVKVPPRVGCRVGDAWCSGLSRRSVTEQVSPPAAI